VADPQARPARSRLSAGILLYRWRDARLEVLLGHPGGPRFTHRDEGHWTIPKGEVEGDEDLVAVAMREFEEETGSPIGVPVDALIPLGEIVQKGGKRVVAWAAPGELDPGAARSNTFTMEWPPRSGQLAEFPEIDRLAWLTPEDARQRIKETQAPFIGRLEEILGHPANGDE
jgi:predicted NUDIX family NTP pyrophosphohydrolase